MRFKYWTIRMHPTPMNEAYLDVRKHSFATR